MSVVEVAKVAGVSPITVSRVINRHPHVAPETVQAVNEAIEKVGHKPRKRADRRRRPDRPSSTSTIEQKRLDMFVLVVPNARSGFYPSLQKGFTDESDKSNHQVIVSNSRNEVGRQADIFMQLMDKRVAGVAVVPPTEGPSPAHQLRQLQSAGVPVVLLHRGVDGVFAPTFMLPYKRIGYLAGQTLAEQGHRRIACFFSDHNAQTELYESGFRQALLEAGGELPEDMVVYGRAHHEPLPEHERVCESALRDLLALPSHRRPTAIWTSYDTQAELLYLMLVKMGVRVPEQMSLLSFGGTWRNGPLASQISAVAVDECHIGEGAARLLHEMSQGTRSIHDRQEFDVPLTIHKAQTVMPPEEDGALVTCDGQVT